MNIPLYFKSQSSREHCTIKHALHYHIESDYKSRVLPGYFAEIFRVRTGASMDFLIGIRI